jgi:dynein heavy chain 2
MNVHLFRNLNLAETHMTELNVELDSVEKRVAHLKTKLNQNTKEAAEIEFHLNKAKSTLGAAQELVEKLNDEFTRWNFEVGSK